ncbi:MAG: hypothetical protein IV104_13260 [Acidovorax sp.]|nr:hypothetical protein [Acidovorax sp.]
MKERPILFSGPMVRALLDGSKTQTRRVVKPTRGRPIDFLGGGPIGGPDWNNPECWGYEHHDSATWVLLRPSGEPDDAQYPCPYGQPGDRLWVRESFAHMYRGNAQPEKRAPEDVAYMADNLTPDPYVYGSWKPSIHMPRWASRITLEITSVRVERLQDISEADAMAEGITRLPPPPPPQTFSGPNRFTLGGMGVGACAGSVIWNAATAQDLYRRLWESINGPGSWDANPWVWAIEFRRLQ